MEPQRPSQYPFLRMQPFPPSRDVRNAPLPPPPYSAPSSASHHNPTPVYDPFRNRDSDAQRRTQTPPFSTQSQGANGVDYTRQQYTGASGKLHGVAHDTHMRHSGYGSGSLFGSKGENVRGHVDGEDTATYSRRPQNGALSQQHQPALAVTPSASSSSSASTTSIFKHGSGYPMSYASQHQPRRRSLGGGSPPRIYGSAPDQAAPPPPPPPPPPPFTTRQMPPPLSPQHYQPHNMFPPPSSRGPPSVVSNPGARDLPSISSLPRPGSSMSISSMLGSDSERPSRDSAPSVPVLVTPVSSPASTTVVAFSPQQLVFRKEALDNAQAKRSRTPDGNVAKGGTRAMRAYSGGTPHLVNKLSGGSPSEVYRFGPPLRAQPSSEISIFSRDAQVPNASSLYAQQARRTSLGTIPQRPNSQPVSYTTPPRSQYEGRPLPSDPAHTLSSKDCIQVTSSEPDGFGRFTTGNRTAVENIEEQERRLREEADGVKLNSSHFDSGGRHVTSYESQPISGVHEVDNKRDGQTSWNKEDQQRRPNETRRLGQYQAPEAQSSNFDFRKYLSTSQSPFTAGSLRVLQATRQLGGPPSQLHDHARPIAQHTLVTPNESSATDRLNHDTSRVGADGLYRASTSAATEGHQPKGSEESHHQQQHHRGLLNVAADNMKRGGRISPLPQAVQGAQSQMSGPAGEPGIKSEFGRMFSGIGSGVGSAMAMAGMVGSGTPTPSGPSPVKRDERPQRSPFKASDDMTAAKLPRVTSRGGRKSRKIKEEESKLDGESGDGRGTPQLKSARGGKRTRHSHHHHLYQHGHQHGHHHHHHHHHKADDDVASNVPVQPVNTPFSSFNAFRRTATPTQNRSITPSPVTMHHHHHHHHHHTGKAASAPNAPILHKPTITVLSQALLASVAHLSRHHLGSTLYSPKIQLPSSTASHEEAKFGYVTTPSALPRFQGKENCTYTVRVPRFYLAREEREAICRRRAVWGTDVYTDDSDPLAAVMHSGWVRGEWGEEVDISMLDLSINDGMTASSKTTKAGLEPQSILTAPPRGGPMMPRAGKDLHITLLVLPQLQNYASTVAYGVKSRAWGGNHDGMSFKIEKIAWVDEGIGKGEERGGEARRKRLRAMVETRTMAAGLGLQLRVTAPGSIRIIPAKVAVA